VVLDGDEIIAQLTFGPAGRWLVLDLDVRGHAVLSMIVNPGYPVSAITPAALNDLLSRGFATQQDSGMYRIPGVSVASRQLPDLHVRPRPSVGRFRVDGILGFDFALGFTDVCLNVPTLRLRLRP